MKPNKILMAAIMAASLASCSKDDDDKKTAAPAPTPTPVVSLDKSFVSCNTTTKVCTLSGIINENYSLDPTFEWRMQGFTFVGQGNVTVADAAAVTALKASGVTLTIPAGVEVKAFDDAVLVVTRGSKLMAVGTATAPIKFTSLDSDLLGTGEWGGIIIQGFAPQFGFNNTGTCLASGVCNVNGEGGTGVGKFGGDDAADNSGELKYFIIAEGGLVDGPNNEINGLTLQGVGHGTKISYIQVHGNLDDGIEWFGGTVNVTHAILTNNDDDDLDYDEGYKGNIQYVFIRKDPTKAGPSGSNDPRGIEANSKLSDSKQVQETNAVLSNITVIGSAVSNTTGNTQPGILLRGQLTTQLEKVAVKNFTKGCLEAKASELVTAGLVNSLCDFGATTFISGVGGVTGTFLTPVAAIAFDALGAITNAEAVLGAVTAPTAVANGSGFVFETNKYIGAIDPDTTNATRDWYSSWVIPGSMTGL